MHMYFRYLFLMLPLFWSNITITLAPLTKIDFITDFDLFSAPEPKAQVRYCDHALSVVRRPSVRR